MKVKKIFLINLILLTILTLSAVSAADNVTEDVSTSDDAVYESSVEEIEIMASGKDCQMTVDIIKQDDNGTIRKIDENTDIYVNDHDSDYFRVKFPSSLNGQLSLFIDNKFMSDKEITAKTHYLFVNTKSYNLTVGNHSWKIQYSGDDDYSAKTLNGTFYLNPASDAFVKKNPNMNVYTVTKDSDGAIYSINASEDISVKNKNTDYFKVKFPKQVSGTLYLYIDDVLKSEKNITTKTHYFFANAENYNLKVGEHKWAIKYSGDDEYQSSCENGTFNLNIITNKVKINKTTSKITVSKTKTFKAKLYTKKYTATLKANKKAVKKVKVYLTIKGKNYKKTFTATTNSKGQATFKITNLKKKGSYTGTLKYKGSKTVKPAGKKLSIKITKTKCTITAGEDINYGDEYKTVETQEADIDCFIDVSELYKMVDEFRCEKGVWQWAENNVDKIVFNTNSSNTLKVYTADEKLEEVAKLRAVECSASYSHIRPDGSICFSAYPNSEDGYTARGENIAKKQKTCADVMEAWKETEKAYDEQGHRRNMLSTDFNSIGIAAYKADGIIHWVQAFGKNDNLMEA